MWIHRRSGQLHQRGLQDHRDAYERDRTRVIHCPAFRRLQRKTQILGTAAGDFHRTRLTHSLEVDSIGRSIVRNLNINHANHTLQTLLPTDDLISAICLLHDIGHPPFGHGGEVALNVMMHEHGGFESNGQTLRLLTKTENCYGHFGLDLTRRTLLGVLKYPVNYDDVVAPKLPEVRNTLNPSIQINEWKPPKAYFASEQSEIDWLLSPFSTNDRRLFQSLRCPPENKKHGQAAFHTFDCSIMNIADDIAYGVHDLEDAIHLRLINRDQFDNADCQYLLNQTCLAHHCSSLLDALFSDELMMRKQAIGEMVNYFITATTIAINHEEFENTLLKYVITLPEEALNLLHFLKKCIYDNVIDSQEARVFEYGGQTIILRLFEALSSNPSSLLDTKNRTLYLEAQNEKDRARVICDYIANMTDEYAHRLHEQLFSYGTRSIFERL